MKKTLATVLLVAIVGFLIAAAPMQTSWDFAQEQKKRCSTGNMIEMNNCLSFAYAESDKRLNVVYRHLMSALSNPEPLRKTQLAWIQFRDLQCAFEVPPSWTGSGVPYSRNSCLIDHTERRIKDLERVGPCNGCVEFKPEFYKLDSPYRLPPR